jgi:hypothetical protein
MGTQPLRAAVARGQTNSGYIFSIFSTLSTLDKLDFDLQMYVSPAGHEILLYTVSNAYIGMYVGTCTRQHTLSNQGKQDVVIRLKWLHQKMTKNQEKNRDLQNLKRCTANRSKLQF